ncbi:hypothetical protein [Williamsoniiplasma lucivorax]|uniref:Transmembrane protein n=1 Tax=Williamsoniiplasma lucivorax TaxID=209274 RepID=A0A2S5REI8_9MOLU|nr:hypothetical protein [Williamsoniiplasma lucivorax]PPE05736.1 hypothetical protein ELUCI_v1c00220 [Williamsoniiplasma lucivorax]
MNIKTRRLINFYWGLITLIIVVGVALLGILAKSAKSWSWQTDVSILTALDFAIFWAFYLIMTSFKKTKYPYLTTHPQDFESHWMQALAWYKWLWIIVVPMMAAITIPLVYILTVATSGMVISVEQILVYVFIPIIVGANNIIYAIVLSRSHKHFAMGEFELKNR